MQDSRIEKARRTAFVPYRREGIRTLHRSCGIALAEMFDRPTAPYQTFRRDGTTGDGRCGAIQAGLFDLGCTSPMPEAAALAAGIALRHGAEITVKGSPVDASRARQIRS